MAPMNMTLSVSAALPNIMINQPRACSARRIRSISQQVQPRLRGAAYMGHQLNNRNFLRATLSRRRSAIDRGHALTVRALLELTEENVEAVLLEARDVMGQLFDESMGMTGVVTLVELDGPVVVLRLKGRFWHERSMILLRMGAYLKEQIPEILDVEIEDEAQLDDSAANFSLE
eukprot:CAMPEP_0198202676 /NCGR_PEP_ID=MMETSP1445-20131203/5882_1 /TAXON_ID=36898 /ORGANISM="Pyramimonas sp., Strain CCMP2087" /LENGTH=173 /DNA_ID=CAMNT_0043873721 /DNA_START=82 /DNA_END=603 /DNA_ORIENTATION=-